MQFSNLLVALLGALFLSTPITARFHYQRDQGILLSRFAEADPEPIRGLAPRRESRLLHRDYLNRRVPLEQERRLHARSARPRQPGGQAPGLRRRRPEGGQKPASAGGAPPAAESKPKTQAPRVWNPYGSAWTCHCGLGLGDKEKMVKHVTEVHGHSKVFKCPEAAKSKPSCEEKQMIASPTETVIKRHYQEHHSKLTSGDSLKTALQQALRP